MVVSGMLPKIIMCRTERLCCVHWCFSLMFWLSLHSCAVCGVCCLHLCLSNEGKCASAMTWGALWWFLKNRHKVLKRLWNLIWLPEITVRLHNVINILWKTRGGGGSILWHMCLPLFSECYPSMNEWDGVCLLSVWCSMTSPRGAVCSLWLSSCWSHSASSPSSSTAGWVFIS